MRSKTVAPFPYPVVRNPLTVRSNSDSSFQAGDSKSEWGSMAVISVTAWHSMCHQGQDLIPYNNLSNKEKHHHTLLTLLSTSSL